MARFAYFPWRLFSCGSEAFPTHGLYYAMQLSHYTDYALRVLLYLAVRPDERATIALISRYFDISHEHLRKIIHELSKLEYIKTYQGKGGGFELARAPDKINVGKVLAHLEGHDPLIDCAGISCRLSSACTLSKALAHAQRAFFKVMEEYTLADLISNKAMVKELVAAPLIQENLEEPKMPPRH